MFYFSNWAYGVSCFPLWQLWNPGELQVPLYTWDPWDMSVHYLNLDSDGCAKKVFAT